MSLTPWSWLLSCLLHFGSPHLAPFHGVLFFVSQGMPSLGRLHSPCPLGAGRKAQGVGDTAGLGPERWPNQLLVPTLATS